MNIKLSVVILTKNEEKNIEECLKGLGWCDEVIVIDDYSEDKTVEIAKKRGARIFKRRLRGDFAAQRNFGLKKAKGEWVLFLDPDERLSPSLSREIIRRLKKADKKKINGFYLKRKEFFINDWLRWGETTKIKLLRLARKKAGQWQGKVHETWEVRGKKETLKNPLFHYSHLNLTDFLKKINFYTTLRAEELLKKGENPSLWKIIVYPLAKFFRNYLLFQGFRDKERGIIFALGMTFHSFLVRAKLWEKRKRK